MTAISDRRRHQSIQELLPWWINGTLEESEAMRVKEHLEQCWECREEEARCRSLAALVSTAEELAPVPHPTHLDRLLATIAEEKGSRKRKRRPDSHRLPRWLLATPRTARWVLGAQAAAIVALVAGVLVHLPQVALDDSTQSTGTQDAPASFRTLAAPDGASVSASRLRVVFTPGASESEVRDLLLELRGEIVGGPTRLGSYTIEIPGGGDADPLGLVLEHLRESPLVRFAEPVASGEHGAADET